MKTKLLLNLALLVITLNAFSQDNIELSNKISNSYVENGNYGIYSQKDSDVFEDLKFIEFVKLDTSKFAFAKILIPKVVLVDTKQGDDVKKNQKRIEFVKKNDLEKIIDDLELKISKFDFNNPDIILLGNSKSNPINIKENANRNYEFGDNVIAKYKGENSSKIYFIILFKFNTGKIIREDWEGRKFYETLEFYGIIEENEYNKSISEREIEYNQANENLSKLEKEKLKEESKKWLSGNFIKIFPEEKIYVYDASYLFRGEIVEGEGISEHKVNTLALSNINPSTITKEDFPKNKELNFVSYKYIKDYNVIDLFYDKKTVLDSIFNIKEKSHGWFEDWKKGVSVDPMIDLEKDAILGGEKNINKYNKDYFLKKIKNKDVIVKQPLFLISESDFKINRIDRDVREKQVTSLRFKILNDINISADNNYFNVYQSGGKSTIEEFSGVRRDFDTRVDKPNYNFVTCDTGFFNEFASNYSGENASQTNKENIEELIAYQYSKEIASFDKFLNEAREKNKQNDQNKQALINKFGAKYTNEALKGNIIVGMPEGLLPIPLRLWQITSRTNWKDGYRIYCTSNLNSSAKLSVYVQNGKVSMVSY
jgi:hypothetical protein